MTTRTMWDAVNPANIPADAGMVAGYGDGPESQWPADAWDRWPTAVKVRITTNGEDPDAIVVDCETGDFSPDSAVDEIQRRRARGLDPTEYCSAGNLWTCRHAFDVRRIPQPHWWVADPNKTLELGGGIVALQQGYFGGFDTSIVADVWPGVDVVAPPVPPPPGPTSGPDYPEENMQAHSGQVTMKDSHGWFQIPADEQAGQVVSVNVLGQSPDAAGKYVPVPGFVSLATDHSTLEFGPGPYGAVADGDYGFEWWTV